MAQDYFGFKKPSNKIIVAAIGNIFYSEYYLESATNAYAGRVAMSGTNADDVVVADGATAMPIGFIGFEQSFLGSTSYTANRPATVDTIWAVNAKVPVIMGGGFWIVGAVAIGVKIAKGDLLAPWNGGTLVPVVPLMGGFGVRIPFTKNTSEADTGVDLPTGIMVTDVLTKVTTAAGSSTIDVGILSTESGGDADGFVDGAACTPAGWVQHINGDTTEANNTLGVLLVNASVKSADTSAKYFDLKKFHVSDGTAISISYTTSDHTVAGDIYVICNGLGFYPVAIAEEDITTATSAVTDCMVRSLI
jgi:hypothetical protein